MVDVDTLRGQIIDELWLPIVREARTKFYTRPKKSKGMKLFTLTDGISFKEIRALVDAGLVQRGDAVLWVGDMIKVVRAESESIGTVLNGSVYNESFLGPASPLCNHLPFYILNLDYSSQDSGGVVNRIEQEIARAEEIIILQSQNMSQRFVLIQTTVIDSGSLDKDGICRASDEYPVGGWGGLNGGIFPQPISDDTQKICFIDDVIKQICQKHGYQIHNSTSLSKPIPGGRNQLHSVAGIFIKAQI